MRRRGDHHQRRRRQRVDRAVAVSRTLSFVIGLALAGLAAMAALGDDAAPRRLFTITNEPGDFIKCANCADEQQGKGKVECAGHDEELRLLRAIAQPQTVTGIPTSYMQGGGCFNFVMNGVQYSLPDAGVNAHTPRGGQGAIDGWKLLLVTVPRKTVTFNTDATQTAANCVLQGFEVSEVSSP